jgi:hypothetical protein
MGALAEGVSRVSRILSDEQGGGRRCFTVVLNDGSIGALIGVTTDSITVPITVLSGSTALPGGAITVGVFRFLAVFAVTKERAAFLRNQERIRKRPISPAWVHR